MDNKQHFEFFLVRYVPNALKGEFVNIGVVLLAEDKDQPYVDLRFTKDWRRVKCLDPGAEVEILEALEREIRAQLDDTHDREILVKRLQDSFSNIIQVSAVKACVGKEPHTEMETLARLYLEVPRSTSRRKASGRQRIVAVMRAAFEQAGVWDLLDHQIPVAEYTHQGDPLKIDCGYRTDGVIKMLHAVSLNREVGPAKMLAFSYPHIANGIKTIKECDTALTAIVDEGLDHSNEGISFALAMLRLSKIRVAPSDEMPDIAEEVARELRA